MTRARIFRDKNYRKYCRNVPNGPQLQQSIDCGNKPCDGEDSAEVRRLNDWDKDYMADEGANGTGEEWLQV